MAISVRASVAWAVVTADSVVTLPTHQAGDRIYIFAAWKAFDTTAQISGWTEVTEFADGSVAASAGLGSVKVGCWYKDAVSSSESNPTLDWSVSPVPGARCAITLQKASNESWDTPLFATAAIAAATNWSATASATVDVKDGAIILEAAGFRDDSATMTRSATTALEDDGSPNVTWNGNVVEDPATHASSTSSNDISADLIHRFVTTGATGVNFTATGTLAASETGACLWVHQGVTADTTAPTLSSQAVGSITTGGGTPSVSTDEGNGTAYMVVVPNGDSPSVAQIKAGQNSSGGAALANQNQAVSGTGVQTFSAVTGLASNTAYDCWFVHTDAFSNDSTAVKADFTTLLAFDDIRQDIINGLDSAQSEGTGWNAEVRDNLAVTAVVRTSDTVVTITLSAQAGYDITAQETITVTLPAAALTGGEPIVATPTFTVDVEAEAPTHDSSGALVGPGAVLVGAADSSTARTSSGALVGPGAAIEGAASSATTRPSSGVLVGPGAVVVGSAAILVTHLTSGVLVGPGAAVVGAAALLVTHLTSGVLVGPGAVVVGAAARLVEHASSGVLVGPGAELAGAASSATTRPSSGVLVGPGAVLAGAANRTRVHPSSGVIVGPGATLAGSASSATTRPSSGALVGQGAVLVGSASSKTTRTSSGVLVGPGATLAGAASKKLTHTTSGVLVGLGAELRGAAASPLDEITGYVDLNYQARTRAIVHHNAQGNIVGKGAELSGSARITRTGQNPLALLLISA